LQRRNVLLLGAVAAVLLGMWFGPRIRRGPQADSLPDLLALAPADSTMIVYADLAALRRAPLVERLISMAPPVNLDRDYTEFVRGTGFAFERDLDRLMLVSRSGPTGQTLAFAEGRFDRQKIGQYALRSGRLENHNGHPLYILPSATPGKNISITFLKGDRIALSDGGNPLTMLPDVPTESPGAFEPALRERLSRVGGSPFFAVAKLPQPGAVGSAPTEAAANLSTPFQYVRWISLAARPDDEQVILSAEGECDGAENAQKVATALEFLRSLLSGGLSDPKARGRMPAETAVAASRLLQAAKISNDADRVRLLLAVTPDMVGALGSSTPATSNPSSR